MYNMYGSGAQRTADELAIKNMLAALEYSEKYGLFDEKEKRFVEDAIKAHVLINAKLVSKFLGAADDYMSSDNKTKTR